MTTSTDKATNKQRLLSRLNSVRVEGWCSLQDFWMFMWKWKPKTVKKLDNRSHPFRVQISASFSRSELSCRRGGGAGREEPYFWWLTRPVCFSQAAPTQSPPQSVHQHTASCKSSDSESRFLTGECGLLGLWRIFPHTQFHSTSHQYDDNIFPFECTTFNSILVTRSPVPALGEGTRGRRDWRSARKACCAAKGRRQKIRHKKAECVIVKSTAWQSVLSMWGSPVYIWQLYLV